AKNSPGYSHSYVKMTEDMVMSPVVDISVENVRDLNVMNLEVEEDNSFVASNQVVHNCVFFGLCVDACPFDALCMTNDYELSSYDKPILNYSPELLALPATTEGCPCRLRIHPKQQ